MTINGVETTLDEVNEMFKYGSYARLTRTRTPWVMKDESEAPPRPVKTDKEDQEK